MEKTIDCYIKEYLEEREFNYEKRKGTLNRKSMLRRFFTYLGESGLSLREIGIKEAQSYQSWLCEKGRIKGGEYSRTSIHKLVSETAVFYEFLRKRNVIISNPFTEINRIKEEKRIPKNILKEDEMNTFLTRLLQYDKASSLWSRIEMYRTHVISEVMYSTGLRISETADLKPDDIDFEKGLVFVREGKNSKQRVCFLNDYAKEVLRLYVNKMRGWVFNNHNFKNKDRVFGTKGSWLHESINRSLKGMLKKTKYPVITSHGFRHAMGYHLLKAGCDIRYIQELLGHSRLKTTQIYTKVDKEDLKEILDKYHPRKIHKSLKGQGHDKDAGLQSN